MLIGFGSDLSGEIVHLNQYAAIPAKKRKEEDKSVKDSVAAVQYKNSESKWGHMDRRKETEIVHDNTMYTDLQGSVNISSQYAKNR